MARMSRWVWEHALHLVMLAAYTASRVAYSSTGLIYDTGPLVYAWQYVDPVLLQEQPIQSLWYLHAQPPLFNLFLSLGLRLPYSGAVTFHVVYIAIGLAILWLCFDLGTRLGLGRRLAAAIALVIITSPACILYENWLFYEYPLACLMLALLDLFHRYVSTGRLAAFIGVVSTGAAIVLIRSLFHPLWLVLVIALAVLARRPSFRVRTLLVVVAVPTLLIGGLVVKNWVLFGSPALSSWLGMNLARTTNEQITDTQRAELISSGRIAPVNEVLPFQPYEAYEGRVPPCEVSHPDIPVLAERRTSTGADNFNYECFLPIYRTQQHDGIVILRAEPRRFIRGQIASYEIYFKSSTKNWFLNGNRSHFEGFDEWYRRWVLLEVPHTDDPPTGVRRDQSALEDLHISLLAVLATLVTVLAGAVCTARWRRRGANATRCTLALFGVTTLAMTVLGNAFEIGENNRFRFTIEPAQFVVLAACIACAVRWGRGRLAARSTSMDAAIPS